MLGLSDSGKGPRATCSTDIMLGEITREEGRWTGAEFFDEAIRGAKQIM